MVMKRISLLAVLLLACGSLGFADVIDKPVATVKLTRLEAITAKQFRQKVELLESRTRTTLSLEDRKKLLDLLISEILIKQAAAQDNVTVTQAEVAQRMDQAKKSGGLQLNLNRELSDAEFKSLVEQSGISWEEYSDQLQKSILTQKYVMQKKRTAFDAVGQPSEAEILDFYETNKAAFVVPDMVRFKHIFIDTRNLTDKQEKEKALARAEEISRELKNGAAFDDLVVKYSDDKASRYKGGDFGYLRRDDQARKQLLGKEFFEAPFRMKVNESSGVLQSNIGYHIIRITEKIPFRLLALDDPIPPQNTSTARQEISAQLMLKKQADLYQQVLQDLLAELRKKAEIKIFEDNLTW
jgi:peptidyl-prolyl cis-trans isomerase SurA